MLAHLRCYSLFFSDPIPAAKEKQANVIVVGRRGLGVIKRLLLGSVSRYILENAPCDVIVVKVVDHVSWRYLCQLTA
jgi:hypothetical protein